VGHAWLRSAALTTWALCALPGCYAGFQSTTSIVQSDGIPETSGPPNSTLSYELQTYELTGGFAYGRLELFGGAGLGTQQLNIRTTSQAQSYDETGFRMHAGVSYLLTQSGPLRLRGFAIYGTQTGGLFGEDLELTELSSSMEGGFQVSAILPSESIYFEPLFRLGLAAQSGSTEPGLYQNEMGEPDFDGIAITASIGFNLGFMDFFDE
tara:strand:- start:24293 stop:24919 length:627 start_codon:yes stop_codon:yes gene_type:complete